MRITGKKIGLTMLLTFVITATQFAFVAKAAEKPSDDAEIQSSQLIVGCSAAVNPLGGGVISLSGDVWTKHDVQRLGIDIVVLECYEGGRWVEKQYYYGSTTNTSYYAYGVNYNGKAGLKYRTRSTYFATDGFTEYMSITSNTCTAE